MRAKLLAVLAGVPLVSACVGGSGPIVPPAGSYAPPVARPTPSPTRVPPTNPAPPPVQGFMQPQIMRGPGLEEVSGASEARLLTLFGTPALNVTEGDAKKLQFRGSQCVLDVYLYPLRPGAPLTATWIEARRPDNGTDVDRAGCVRALKR